MANLKWEIESLVVAAENQSIRTNLVKLKTDRSQGNIMSIDHVSGCSKLSLTGNNKRHDNLGKIVHLKLNQEV